MAVNAFLSFFDKANGETRWSSGGKSYVLRVRPLLPDESSCTDVYA